MPGSISLATIDGLLEGNPAYPGSGAPLRVQTLGGFRAWRDGAEIAPTAWGREKATHLFQFFLTLRRRYLHIDGPVGDFRVGSPAPAITCT